MPKLKTNKAASKKVKITGKKKVIRRSTSQNHYNTRETGKFKRNKRNDHRLFKTDEKNLLNALPYGN